MVDVDHRTPDVGDELGREDLHVTRQHHQIDVSTQQLENTFLRFCANVLGGGDVQERHAEWANLIGQVRMVRDHHHDRHVEFTAAVTP